MRALSASELLSAWEQGLAQPPAQRALTLLVAACPDTPSDTLARLSIGQRDVRLLALREWTFGSKLVSLATCPGCGERLELTLNVADIRVAPEAEPAEAQWMSVSGYEVGFRLPNSLDLDAIAETEEVATARHLLVERCILTAHHNGEERGAHQLPAEVIDAVVARMGQADPQADVQLALSCPVCEHQWQVTLDVVSYFWSEINAWASRMLNEVHTLASAYGWREADILAMSPWRRQLYLQMV